MVATECFKLLWVQGSEKAKPGTPPGFQMPYLAMALGRFALDCPAMLAGPGGTVAAWGVSLALGPLAGASPAKPL
jgi:hypothetical protein